MNDRTPHKGTCFCGAYAMLWWFKGVWYCELCLEKAQEEAID